MATSVVKLTCGGVLRGARQLSALSLFVIPFGMAYGIAAVEAGMSAAQTITASALTFSGAAQFTVLDLWGAEMSLLTLFLVTLAVSARHIVMSAALSPWVNQLEPKQRVLSIAFMSDPNFAHAYNALKQEERDVGVLTGSGLIVWAAWVVGTAIGVVGGGQIGEPEIYGIDVLMPVYFAALVAPNVFAKSRWAFVGVAALVAIISDPFVPSGWNIILAAIAGGLAGVMTDDA